MSDLKATCVIKNYRLEMPSNLFAFLKKPLFIFLIPEVDNAFFIKAHHPLEKLKHYLKLPLKFILKKKRKPLLTAKMESVENNKTVYRLMFKNGNSNIKDGEYHIVNYETLIYLMPLNKEDVAKSRQKAWASMHNYHEHREITLQDKEAVQVSRWLSFIFESLNPASILEIGCGAGRNLLIAREMLKGTRLSGIDINEEAIKVAQAQSDGSIEFSVLSLYELKSIKDNSVDIVFTSGVLMHVPNDKVVGVINEMHRIAKKAVIHFELHGPSNNFDYHRYPRDYKKLYETIGLVKKYKYEIFPLNTFQSKGTNSFNHSLLLYEK